MKAIILAAGEGKRLRPLTNDKPKCMVKVLGKSLLEWQLITFRKCKIDDISVVRGYKKDEIKFPEIKYYFNEKFESTNMIETLFCAENEFNEPIIISYGDIIYEKKVLEKLMDDPNEFAIIIDKNWENYWKMRFENPLDDAESLKINDEGNIIEIGQKTNNIKDIQGQYIGLIKVQGKGLEIIKSFYKKSKNESIKTGKNPLNEKLSFENSFMTDFLQGLIKEQQKLKPIYIKNGWLEVDSIKDYKLYEKMTKEKTISKLIQMEN
ncbi:MAG: phosphocholine cytidylyltransferase family protein [Nitrosopumilus sp.]|nr:phosphocholine cytidylyltransferase family protein [Nitrosopumilus sp.]